MQSESRRIIKELDDLLMYKYVKISLTHVYCFKKIQAMANYPKHLEGLCVGVLSGDRILFQGPPDKEQGGYKQKILHLSGIQAPKIDAANSKEERYSYASREFMRKRLVGIKHKFTIEKKVNEIQIGYVILNGEDATIGLLREGLAKLRTQKSVCEHFDDYKYAEEDARMAQVGIWNESNDKNAYRRLRKDVNEQEILKQYKGEKIRGIVEEVHPSKAVIYLPKDQVTITINYSQVQVVVLSEKLPNGESKNNARAIRSVLESSFLQREVEIIISPESKETITGYIISDEGKDVRKVLLENGFAKLSKDAISGVTTKQFMELKGVAQKALEEGLGLWKEQKSNATKTYTSGQKQYDAVVYEVHSGDSVSVIPQGKTEPVRLYFTHTRAPSANQPYNFESKDALRKRCIGKKVKVIVEFTKKIPVKKNQGDAGELKDFTFASIFESNVNLAAYMLEQGLVAMQQIRTEEEVSKFLEALKDAEAKGKKERRGLHKAEHIKIPNYNDVSGGKGKKVDASKAKALFEFLKDEPVLTGVIELVLNGSRFKVRFNQQHVMAIVVLDGVRCLPNEGQYSKISEQALNFTKNLALQRDFEIKLKRVDLKGVYHGVISIGKKDIAAELLENGLAVTIDRNKNFVYEELEKEAKNKGIGLWKYDFNLSSFKGETEKEFKPVNFTKNLILVEVPNPYEIYLENEGCKKPDVPQKPAQATNYKVGDIVTAQFTDGVYYRAKVLKATKDGCDVHFIDYGNYDFVPKAKIGVIDEALRKIRSPLIKASLYGLDGLTKEAGLTVGDQIGKKLKVEIKEQSDDGEYRVILWPGKTCLNLDLLELGEAENTTTNPEWIKAEETARRNREGKWDE